MGTHITILEAILISGISIIGYALVKTIFQSLKSK
jgi:hypothetical protein